MHRLDELRKRIDQADRDLLEALASRMEIVDDILQEKENRGLPLFDAEREKSLLTRMAVQAEERQLDPRLVERVLREVISHSRAMQTRRVQESLNPDLREVTRVGYQGTSGAYSWTACRNHFGADVQSIGYRSFREAFEALESGQVDLALLPIENTLAGSIHEVYDLLASTRTYIVGEEVLKIDHCLLGIEPSPLEEIRRIFSHPVALQQCGTFVRGLPQATCQAYIDTAEAVRKVKEDGDPRQAAIASLEAADLYGLFVLRESVSDHRENYTRFFIIAREPAGVDERIPAKTSLLLVTDHREGALVECLKVLHSEGVNMTKLESRPRRGTPWQYQFYLDVEGNVEEERLQKTFDRIRDRARFLRILGCYPKADAKAVSAARVAGRVRGLKQSVSTAGLLKKNGDVGRSRERVVVTAGSVEIGSGDFVVIAGPTILESETELEAAASLIASHGADILRCGDFESVDGNLTGDPSWPEKLSAVAHENELPLMCEVHTLEQIAVLPTHADVLWVGARNMQNYSLLRELGRIDKPILLERGLSSTLEEFINAAEQIVTEGNQQVILCERGIRTFETRTRELLDLGAVVVLKDRTRLPIVVNPCAGAGRPEWVLPLARAARSAGADGLVLDVNSTGSTAEGLDASHFIALMAEFGDD